MAKKPTPVYRPRFQMDFGEAEDRQVAKRSWDRFYAETRSSPENLARTPPPPRWS
jgi:hypothetical protein